MTVEFVAEDDVEPSMPCSLADGETIVADYEEFLELTNAHAVMSRDGNLYVLRRDTMKWCCVEGLPPTKSKAALSAIPG
jgi:hypothetical protein